jgi:hypothetical protein
LLTPVFYVVCRNLAQSRRAPEPVNPPSGLEADTAERTKT